MRTTGAGLRRKPAIWAAVLALMAVAPATAEAGVGASAVPNFPTAVTVGNTGCPGVDRDPQHQRRRERELAEHGLQLRRPRPVPGRRSGDHADPGVQPARLVLVVHRGGAGRVPRLRHRHRRGGHGVRGDDLHGRAREPGERAGALHAARRGARDAAGVRRRSAGSASRSASCARRRSTRTRPPRASRPRRSPTTRSSRASSRRRRAARPSACASTARHRRSRPPRRRRSASAAR